jgi:hypothetical protein
MAGMSEHESRFKHRYKHCLLLGKKNLKVYINVVDTTIAVSENTSQNISCYLASEFSVT